MMKGCVFLLMIGVCCTMSFPFRSRRSLEAETFSARVGITVNESQAILNWTKESKKAENAEQARNELKTMCNVIVANKETVEKTAVDGDSNDIGDLSAKDKKQAAIWEGFSSADDLGKITRIRRVCNIELH